ncbi:hypothetical protein SETIT_1G006000v2 [Setaria italica]|uniref:EF-hand domain-containing protein n=1 Tax=Setaria italica TaxID=4555 RepID=A0A368PFZ3_SETIT|nr:probable serine/threonine-protein phosphatase 2A regulatory subunit B'' subunit TON2 [Setaria italica]RCV04493.1 hypothetical protein SETIT_1G006000v2 [Setaria italica]
MELHQESEEEVTDTEQAENWFSLTSAQRICDMFLALDKDQNGTLSKQELKEYADGTLTEIFIERVFDEHVHRSKVGGGNSREMDFESFLDFVLALDNKDTAEGLTYLFRCLDLNGRGFLTTADIHTLFRYVWTTLHCAVLFHSYDSCALIIDILVQFGPLWLPF